MIPHQYTDATDDIGQYQADLCDRQAVTMLFAWEHLVGQTLYYFSVVAHEFGLEPWWKIEGVDRMVKSEKFVLEIRDNHVMTLKPHERIYVDRSTLRSLGLPEGRPGGPAISRTPERKGSYYHG